MKVNARARNSERKFRHFQINECRKQRFVFDDLKKINNVAVLGYCPHVNLKKNADMFELISICVW